MAALLEALEDILQPTIDDHMAWAYALELFVDFKRYGLPHGGGHAEQDAEYMYILDCILTAQERAEREIRAADAKMRNQGTDGTNENEVQTSDMGGVAID